MPCEKLWHCDICLFFGLFWLSLIVKWSYGYFLSQKILFYNFAKFHKKFCNFRPNLANFWHFLAIFAHFHPLYRKKRGVPISFSDRAQKVFAFENWPRYGKCSKFSKKFKNFWKKCRKWDYAPQMRLWTPPRGPKIAHFGLTWDEILQWLW